MVQHAHATPARDGDQDRDAYEAYRLYQKDLFRECMSDARLIAKRALAGTDETVSVPELALALFDKRCEPWATYRGTAARATRVR